MITDFLLGIVVPLVLIVFSVYLFRTFRNNEVIKWVEIAVKAADQIFNEPGMGTEKFAYVEKWISEKFHISKTDLKNIIESMVFEINKTDKGKQSE